MTTSQERRCCAPSSPSRTVTALWPLRYRSHDVTDLLHSSGPSSVLGFALGNGWYRGRLGWSGGRGYYGDELGVLAQLEITYADGHRQLIVTDTAWTAGP